jgi:hypothetical protein
MVRRKGKLKRIHTKKWERCVEKVGARDGKYNAYAVCTASLGEKAFLKRR